MEREGERKRERKNERHGNKKNSVFKKGGTDSKKQRSFIVEKFVKTYCG